MASDWQSSQGIVSALLTGCLPCTTTMKVRNRALPTRKPLNATLKTERFCRTRGRGRFVGKGDLHLVDPGTQLATHPLANVSIPRLIFFAQTNHHRAGRRSAT